MNRRIAWGVAAAAVVAAAAGLLYLVRGDGGASGGAAIRRDAGAVAQATGPRRAPPRRADGSRPDPVGPSGPVERIGGGGEEVRDHRSNPGPGADQVTQPQSPVVERKVEPATTAAVRGALRPVVEHCRSTIDASALAPDAYLQVVVVVHIAGGTLTVDEAEVQLRNIDDPSIGDCVRDGALGLSVAAGKHPDVDRATLTHGFQMRDKIR